MKKQPVQESPRVPEPYKIIFNLGDWELVKLGKGKIGAKGIMNIVYHCKAQSENGAHREALLFLAGKL